MPADDLDDVEGLSQAPSGELDTVESLLAHVVASPPERLFSEGARIGRYVLLTRLGAGAMGVVWAAYDPQLDRKVALKILKRNAAGPAGTEARERAAREARALARLVHPNIVAVYDGGLDGDTLFVVMEFVDGVTLRAHLADQPRSVDAIDAFVQAGTGLAAAHDAKLVHRDFKPDNVLVGKDGRVRVADFGLARIAGVADAPGDAPTPASTAASTPAALTATAAFVGTLGYMAPEQMEPGSVDHRADQFAFAVALWDAVHGAMPFSGDTLAARRLAIEAGPVARPGDRKVPSWLYAILRRALAIRPADRFPSMRALLEAIARGRGRRRRIATGALVVLALGTLAPALWWSRSSAAAEPCQGGASEIGRVWNAERAAAVAAAFPDNPAGAAAATRTRDRLDAYAHDWAIGHRAACRATEVDRSQSADLLDRRIGCLARARTRLDALLGWIPAAGVAATDNLDLAIEQLPLLDACADVVALAKLVPQPDEPQARARVVAAAERLDELSAAVSNPTRRVGPAETAVALEQAQAAGWAPLIAEATLVHAEALYLSGERVASDAMYREAIRWALQGAHDQLAARAMADLAWSLSNGKSDGEAQSWVALARAMSQRVGSPPELALQVTTTAAEVARHLGRFDESIAESTAAVALASAPGVAPGALGRALVNLGISEMDAGHYDGAIELFERAIAVGSAALGADHPVVANRLLLLGNALITSGKVAEALPAIDRGLAIREAWYGPDDLALVEMLQMMGSIHQRLGDLDEARRRYERALAILNAHPGSSQRADIEANLAILEALVGRFDVAVELGTSALRSIESVQGSEDPNLIHLLVLLGYAERGRDQLDVSAAHLSRAVAIAERALGPDHPGVANPRVELGVTEVARGRLREGIALFERVVAVGARDPNLDRVVVAEATFQLADALAHTGALPRARRLAAEVRDLYAALGEPYAAQRDAAAQWLAAH